MILEKKHFLEKNNNMEIKGNLIKSGYLVIDIFYDFYIIF